MSSPATTVTSPTAPRPREQWIDMARGGCVLLVVLFHVIIWHMTQFEPAPSGLALWEKFNNVAGAIRMPLLLLLSGMLAAGKLRRGRPALRGAAANYWLYAVWLTIYAVVLTPLHMQSTASISLGWSHLRQFVAPETPLWYVFALSVYLVVLWALRRVPPAVVLVALAALAIVVSPGDVIALKVPNLFIFFALGVYGSPLLRRVVAERAWLLLPVGLVATFIPSVLVRLPLQHDLLTQVGYLFGDLGKGLTAIGLVALWDQKIGPIRPLSWIGRHTLAIYVMHPLLIALWVWLEDRTGLMAPVLRAMGGAAVVYPLLLTAAVAALALVLEQLIRRSPGEWLFGLPPALMQRLQAWEKAGAGPRRALP